ncbi:glycosyltransferase [Belliella pelovolcani]|uniref:Glycosyl transferase family 2 n=1 Tax=Belliella pelovolcani TaxID=529505 RepID=A0A1N7MEA3_9BACT|nr:glycosyltransferase [Belliella pelovolcani]SIS84387.1 Glycosyl transferase family 2 [Belliella pelovolcani]
MNFSVLISCYIKDSVSQLGEALESIINQTLLPSEIILVEDGPLKKRHDELIKEFEKKIVIKRIKIKTNIGLGNALNLGLMHCENEIVVRMDSDDICHPMRFEKQINFFLSNPSVDIVGSWAIDIDNDGNMLNRRTYPVEHDNIIKIIWTCPIIHPSVAYKKQSILSIGSYRNDLKRRQDYEMWLRAASHGLIFSNIPEFLLYYRFTNDYYKKNNIKVAFSQAIIGVKGLNKLKNVSSYAYIGVFFPVFRALLPSFIERPFHSLIRKIDPRTLY